MVEAALIGLLVMGVFGFAVAKTGGFAATRPSATGKPAGPGGSVPGASFTASPSAPPSKPVEFPRVMSFDDVRKIAEQVILSHFPNVDIRMVMAMVQIESAFDRYAERREPHIRNQYTSAGDFSYGLMQPLYTTALWLTREMGFTAFKIDGPGALYDPATNIYIGCAYISWLSRWKGKRRSEDWIVKSYNGGPGADNGQVRTHLAKYHAAKLRQARRMQS